jgi:hypothetical protein
MSVDNPILEKEYESLRIEILQGKQYVFERPIIIISIIVGLMQFLDKEYALYIPILLVFFLTFNIWFTSNRMGSIARIISYIQLILEEKRYPYIGWETSLRNYRKYFKLNNINLRKFNINQKAVYDNLGYYPTIYLLHIAVIIVAIVIMIIFIDYRNILNIIVLCISLLTVLLSLYYFRLIRPKVLIPMIEKNRAIWKCVFIEENKKVT